MAATDVSDRRTTASRDRDRQASALLLAQTSTATEPAYLRPNGDASRALRVLKSWSTPAPGELATAAHRRFRERPGPPLAARRPSSKHGGVLAQDRPQRRSKRSGPNPSALALPKSERRRSGREPPKTSHEKTSPQRCLGPLCPRIGSSRCRRGRAKWLEDEYASLLGSVTCSASSEPLRDHSSRHRTRIADHGARVRVPNRVPTSGDVRSSGTTSAAPILSNDGPSHFVTRAHNPSRRVRVLPGPWGKPGNRVSACRTGARR
jgi:hypothetical protein